MRSIGRRRESEAMKGKVLIYDPTPNRKRRRQIRAQARAAGMGLVEYAETVLKLQKVTT